MTLEQQIAAALEAAEFQGLADKAALERLEARLFQLDKQLHDDMARVINHWRLRRNDMAGELALFSDEVKGLITAERDPLPQILQDPDPMKIYSADED